MIISFDLDDTLIPTTKKFQTEPRTILQRLLGIEELRTGTIATMRACRSKGYKIYIYTTSLRSVSRIRWTFYTYGIRIDRIINHRVHEKTMSRHHANTSKYPPAFNIDIHVDDSAGVEIEGRRFGFRTIIVSNNDTNWAADILTLL